MAPHHPLVRIWVFFIPIFAAIASTAELSLALPVLQLSASATDPRVIRGGSTQVNALVSNTGDADLNYSIRFDFPSGASDVISNETLTAGMSQPYFVDFDSTGLPLGFHNFDIMVNAPGATPDRDSRIVSVQVLAPARPRLFSNTAGMPTELPVEPTFAPEQFGATGGGEQFAAAAPHIVGGSNSPTAALDFDTLEEVGDAQITARNINFFKNLPAIMEGQDPLAVGIVPFDVFLDVSQVGTFTKTFTLGFSDEDLPGARPTGSVKVNLTYIFQVVPEPATAWLYVAAFAAFAAARPSRGAFRGRPS